MPLKIDIVKRAEGGHFVALDGSLDSNTHEEFDRRMTPFLNGGTKVMILDLAKLKYVSSAGLRVVYKVWKNIVAGSGTFLMTNLQPQIQTVFEVIKAMPHEHVFASMEEVDQYLDTIQKREIEKQQGA